MPLFGNKNSDSEITKMLDILSDYKRQKNREYDSDYDGLRFGSFRSWSSILSRTAQRCLHAARYFSRACDSVELVNSSSLNCARICW